jgi:hypothetical protein
MYRVIPISKDAANEVRRNMISPFGKLPASSSVATGYGPCRSCLKTFRQGEEERIYITYNPFAGVSKLPLPGPVFIHTEECAEYSDHGFPKELRSIPLILEGFGGNSRLVRSEPVSIDFVDEQIEEILDADEVEVIHIRNAEAGCFIAKIQRD